MTAQRINPSPGHSARSAIVLGLDPYGFSLLHALTMSGVHAIGYDIDPVRRAQEYGGVRVAPSKADLRPSDTIILSRPVFHGDDTKTLASYVELAASLLSPGCLVIVEAPFNPGGTEAYVLPALSATGVPHELSYVTAPTHDGDIRAQPRVVGAASTHAARRAADLYRRITDAELYTGLTIKEAEACLLAAHAEHDVRSALMTELGMAFDKAGIDITRVMRGARAVFSRDMFATSFEPPRERSYFISRRGDTVHFEDRLLKAAHRVLHAAPSYLIDVLSEALSIHKIPLKRARIAIVGHSEREHGVDGGTAALISMLRKKGASVRTIDPVVRGDQIGKALTGSDAAVVAADHPLLRGADPRVFARSGVAVVLDPKNLMSRTACEDAGITYRGVGRG